MVDIPSATTALTSTVGAASPGTGLTAVQVAIQDISQALADLGRSIQTNATPVAYTGGNELTLMTALGSVTVNLAQQISVAERQILLQVLMNLSQAQKPLTLALPAGSPPTQAVLLVPGLPAVAAPAAAQNVSAPQPVLPPALLPPLAAGEVLTAVVLPPLQQQAGPVNAVERPVSANLVFAANVIPENTNASLVGPSFAPLIPPPVAAPVVIAAPEEVPIVVVKDGPVIDTVLRAFGATMQPETIQAAATEAIAARAQSATAPVVPASLSVSVPGNFVPQADGRTLPPQNPAPLVALLQPGNEVTLRVEAVVSPAAQNAASPAPPEQALPAPAANQVVAVVSGKGTEGQLILKAGDVSLFVKTPAAAPVGSAVLVTLEAAKPEPLVTLPQSLPVNFPALPQAVAALAQNDPQTLMQLMATRMPQPTEVLPGALLFLFSAFKQGNVSNWLGDNATAGLLRAGKLDAVMGLSRELSGAGQVAQDPVVGNWQTYPIPLYAQQQFQALTLYVHSDRDARKDQAASAGVGKIRFLIDMRLSKLGAMQIDGFVQPKKLDMVLRSEAILPEGLHNELRAAYIKALGAVGYAGALNFQVGRQHWMMMRKAAQGGVA